jgi:hypothetical protein
MNSPDPTLLRSGARSPSGGFHPGRWLALLVLLAAAGMTAWCWVSLRWAYSEGERAGVLQKFSSKGWICKTYEGELALYVVGGVSPQIWYFSVRDPRVAAELGRQVGERLQLHYTEHRGVPTQCFAETPYFVEGYRVVGEAPQTSYQAPLPPPAPQTAPASPPH